MPFDGTRPPFDGPRPPFDCSRPPFDGPRPPFDGSRPPFDDSRSYDGPPFDGDRSFEGPPEYRNNRRFDDREQYNERGWNGERERGDREWERKNEWDDRRRERRGPPREHDERQRDRNHDRRRQHEERRPPPPRDDLPSVPTPAPPPRRDKDRKSRWGAPDDTAAPDLPQPLDQTEQPQPDEALLDLDNIVMPPSQEESLDTDAPDDVENGDESNLEPAEQHEPGSDAELDAEHDAEHDTEHDADTQHSGGTEPEDHNEPPSESASTLYDANDAVDTSFAAAVPEQDEDSKPSTAEPAAEHSDAADIFSEESKEESRQSAA